MKNNIMKRVFTLLGIVVFLLSCEQPDDNGVVCPSGSGSDNSENQLDSKFLISDVENDYSCGYSNDAIFCIENTGEETWSSGEGYTLHMDGDWYDLSDYQDVYVEEDVESGGVLRIEWRLEGGYNTGSYLVSWKMRKRYDTKIVEYGEEYEKSIITSGICD